MYPTATKESGRTGRCGVNGVTDRLGVVVNSNILQSRWNNPPSMQGFTAKLQMRGSSGGIIRGLNKIWGNVRDPTGAYVAANTAIPSSRKCLHSSVYEKNEDDGLHLNRVPEDVIEPESQKSWVPHPETGVFGPAEEQNWSGGDQHSSHEKSGESVLEQHVWYRPLEDVEKQPYN